MLSPPRLPVPKPQSPQQSLGHTHKSMTIALGTLCAKGVIVAADRRIVSGTATQDVCKVHSAQVSNGAYVIAYAADDRRAAATLARQLIADLGRNDPKTLTDAEKLLTKKMTAWARAFGQIQPKTIEFVFGASIPNGGGTGLYYCEPPNTVLRNTKEDEERGYVSVGCGGDAVVPFHRMLFLGFGPNGVFI